MARMKKGVHYFPNKRALLSTLPRVNSDLALSRFYNGIATAFANKPITLDAFMEHWEAQAQEHLTPEWQEYVFNNAEQYIKALAWHHNPMFAATLISRYRQIVDEVQPATVADNSHVEDKPQPKTSGGIVVEPSLPVTDPAPLSETMVVGVDEAVEGGDETVVASYEWDAEDGTLHVPSVQKPESATIQAGLSDDEDVDTDIEGLEEIEEPVEDVAETISEQMYQELMADVKEMTIPDMEGFAELYGIELTGKRRKAEIRDAIFEQLSERVVR